MFWPGRSHVSFVVSYSSDWWLQETPGLEGALRRQPLTDRGGSRCSPLLLAASSLRREVPGDDSSGTGRKARNRPAPGAEGRPRSRPRRCLQEGGQRRPASRGQTRGRRGEIALGAAGPLSGARGLKGVPGGVFSPARQRQSYKGDTPASWHCRPGTAAMLTRPTGAGLEGTGPPGLG